ncbi:cell division protein CrgA [Cellulomonas sp. HZM]|uniref:cell division protein CrgA n=1 Tax=Cellulomonas sp. HZM TaxID=1454010 RepID=UPI0004931D45|nr:cell division protein CrgA [Cellulomonas sp. HZM]
MPESRSRKKATYTPPTEKSAGPKVNPPWFVPTMLGLMILGLVWIVVTYLSRSQYPIPGIHQWNLAIGAVFIVLGFGMTTRWR